MAYDVGSESDVFLECRYRQLRAFGSEGSGWDRIGVPCETIGAHRGSWFLIVSLTRLGGNLAGC